MSNTFVSVKNVVKEYNMGEVKIIASNNVSFDIKKGELCVILGSSGAGKSTILNMLGGMDSPNSGEINIDGKDIAKYNQKQLTEYRRFDIGFVFQFYNLVPNLTARENIEIAAQICKNSGDINATLKDVGLYDRMDNFPSQLSGGEQQRVSIARALCKNPKLLLCDEPTGALDYHMGKSILKLLQNTAREKNITSVIITHNTAIKNVADKVITIKNSKVDSIIINENPVDVDAIEW